MKKYVLMIALLLLVVAVMAQPKSKPKEKPPTQKEMEDMMKEMQAELDGLSAEDKKMMDSMGIKLPDPKSIQKNMAGVTDADLKKAFDDENRIVPEKDVARINTALSTTVSNAQMGAFIHKTHLFVLGKLSAGTKSRAVEIMQQTAKKKGTVANAAIGLWVEGRPTLALYLLGEACKTDPDNANNLNNYAALLTMCGGEEMALPILMNLKMRFPKNSTLMNNIAQAWLGLGELQRAEKYADSAIRIFSAHPQANMVKCLIEESRGNIPAAIAAAKKAISKSYSVEKEGKLKKLGYNLEADDLNWLPPKASDQLGLGKFKWPAFPLDVEENKLSELEWKTFKAECEAQLNKLKSMQAQAEKDYERISGLRMQAFLKASQSNTGKIPQMMPGYAAKAIKKLGPGVNDVNGNMSFVFAQALEPVAQALLKAGEYEKLLSEKQEELNKKYEDKFGEGRENPMEQVCKDENAIRTDFLKKANGELQKAYTQYFNYVRRRTSDLLTYYQYTLWPEQFELAKINAQVAWLTQIKDQRVYFKDKSSWCPKSSKTKKFNALQNFDDVACKYVSTLNLGVFTIVSSCSNLTGEFDFGGIQITAKDNVETGRYSGTLIAGISKSFGPEACEGELTIGGLVEIDNTGITDVGVVGEVAVSAGPVTVGTVEMKATINTGVSTSGKFLGQK